MKCLTIIIVMIFIKSSLLCAVDVSGYEKDRLKVVKAKYEAKNYIEALKDFEQLALQADSDALLMLAYMNYYGLGTKADVIKAQMYYEIYSYVFIDNYLKRPFFNQNNYLIFNYKGDEVKKKIDIWFDERVKEKNDYYEYIYSFFKENKDEYLHNIASSGNIYAQKSLAEYYSRDDVNQKDLDVSYMWLTVALKLNMYGKKDIRLYYNLLEMIPLYSRENIIKGKQYSTQWLVNYGLFTDKTYISFYILELEGYFGKRGELSYVKKFSDMLYSSAYIQYLREGITPEVYARTLIAIENGSTEALLLKDLIDKKLTPKQNEEALLIKSNLYKTMK